MLAEMARQGGMAAASPDPSMIQWMVRSMQSGIRVGVHTISDTVTIQDPRVDPPQGESGEVVTVRADMARDVADDMEALARIADRSPSEELNYAASFWVHIRKAAADGAQILIRDRRGRTRSIDLSGKTPQPDK